MSRNINPAPQFLDGNGDPVVNGKLYFFKSGTNTPIATYSDKAESIPNTHPVLLDAAGRQPNTFFTGVAKQILLDENDVQIFERDPVGGEQSDGAFSYWDTSISYGFNDITEGSNGKFYISIKSGNNGNDPTLNPFYWSEIRFIGVYNSLESYSIGDIVQTDDGGLWKSETASNIGNEPLTNGGINWTQAINSEKTITTASIITSSIGVIAGDIFETSGYSSVGDGGGGQWMATGLTIVPSQTPTDLLDIKLSNALGDEFTLVNDGMVNAAQVGDDVQAAVDGIGSGGGVVVNKTITISEAIKIDGTNSDLNNISISGSGELKLADNVQRKNIIESSSGSGHKVRDLTINHNADRGGFFSRHAPQTGVTANSGILINGTKAIGATSIDVDATTLTGSLGGGDTFKVGVDTTVYTVTNSIVTASSNAMTGIIFTPALVAEATDGLDVTIYQLPRYKTKGIATVSSTILNFNALRVQANTAPFPLTEMYIGEQFQFMRRVSGSLSEYEIDPTHNTVYTITTDVPMAAGGIGEEFLSVGISPALTQTVSADIFITSIQDANNGYSNGIYLGGADNVSIDNVTVNQSVWHGIILGTGPRTAVGTLAGGVGATVTDSTVKNYGGNGIAGGSMLNMVVANNTVDTNDSGVGNGIFPDSGCDESTITGNIIKDAKYGVITYACDRVDVLGNNIVDCNIGVVIDNNSDSSVVSGNTIRGDAGSTAGIFLRKGDTVNNFGFSSVSVNGNTILDIQDGSGIYVAPFSGAATVTGKDDCVFLSIQGNVISSPSLYGIRATSIRASNICDNVISYPGDDGIHISDAEYLNMQDNSVFNAGHIAANASGIFIEESNEVQVDGNFARKIQYTTSNQDYGLEIGANVTNDFIGKNYFWGSVDDTNIDVKNINKTLTVDAVLDFPNISSGSYSDLTVAVTGAKANDIVNIGQPATGTSLVQFFAWVSANDTVTVRARNFAGSAVNLASATYRVQVANYL